MCVLLDIVIIIIIISNNKCLEKCYITYKSKEYIITHIHITVSIVHV